MKYVETPDLMEKTLQYVYGTNRALGNTEMLRKKLQELASIPIIAD